ncbi:glycosyltransferase family 2 protein [Rhodopirellula sp. MGV]|uniref:glycosyltransferase family 2 protein n=1 Tax=Rhodopirellula sp. MGV TaxID=2023130 RepID=UPI000B96DD55|nr:glycosyltransferase family 2 protein [Rhodopirellula sp. MGV]OYP39155.1 hypothetical protein CGZ80_00465 [Rhodopirellula sp. MGV]PNY35468.1 glycosyltransferase family 2 protein [Rhodopirellula baltica]
MSAAESELRPLVSVVMSCFNDVAHVTDAIRSIQAQTLSQWEMIVIDDGSYDGTERILETLAEQDSRLRVIHQPNTGLTRALRSACDVALAPLIARQDSDDVSAPTRLQRQFELFQSCQSIGFVSCEARYLGPGGEHLTVVTRPSDPDEATSRLLNEKLGPPAHGTMMFRKSVYQSVGGYRDAFYYAQDTDLWLRMAEVSKIAYVNETLYDFRFWPGSLTGSGRNVQAKFGVFGQRCRAARVAGQDETPILEEAERLSQQVRASRARNNTIEAPVRDNQSKLNYLVGSQLVKNRDIRGRRYLQRVIHHNPLHAKAWVRLAQSWLQLDASSAVTTSVPRMQ